MRAAPGQFVIYFISANGKRGQGARGREGGDDVEDPGLREEVTEESRREGADDITCVIERLVATDSPVKPFVSDEAQTDPREGGQEDGPHYAHQRLRRHHSRHTPEPENREATYGHQQGCQRHQRSEEHTS